MRVSKFPFRPIAALLGLALTLTIVPLSAQQRGIAVDQVRAGSTLVATTDVPVRAQAPSGGALYIKGQQTGALRNGDVITVDRQQMVATVLGNQKWVYFSRSGSPSNGWVLVGNAGTTSGNFGAKH
jgi:hypothetical protein